MRAIVSFDVEDWHQLVGRRLGLPDEKNPAFERQMRTIFALLDELGVHATFFLLGMSVERHPRVVEEIVARGDEVACHGYAHERVYAQGRDDFRADVERCVALVERLTGRRPFGYRAPAFSITREAVWAYDVLAELGFRYDSSQYDSPRIPNRITPVPSAPYRLRLESGRELDEFPIAVWRRIPVGGGAYWRVLPAAVLRRALAALPAPALYFHPYELDPEPLRVQGAPWRTAAALSLRRNPGRGLVARRLRAISREFTLGSYEEAYADAGSPRAGSKALSPQGVLV
jgi:polysaccharide deacetylase family protein (PEP-CTERM system associated)